MGLGLATPNPNGRRTDASICHMKVSTAPGVRGRGRGRCRGRGRVRVRLRVRARVRVRVR